VRLPRAFPHCRKRGVRTNIRVRIDANCLAGGVDRAGQRPSWAGACGACTAAWFARMGKDERKTHRE